MPRLIKRYDNRKLYDTEEKRYISLDGVADLIRQGVQVQILENSTGDDITSQTLTRIIVEGERQGWPALPSEVLHELVRWGGNIMSTTTEQLDSQIDALIRSSLGRIGPLRQVKEEMERLRERVGKMEVVLAGLETDLEGRPGGK